MSDTPIFPFLVLYHGVELGAVDSTASSSGKPIVSQALEELFTGLIDEQRFCKGGVVQGGSGDLISLSRVERVDVLFGN
jgi:hypothetical protein